MKRSTIILALLVLSALAPAQWLDRAFWLTDSFRNINDNISAFVNPVSGRLYLGGEGLHVYDCITGEKHGFTGGDEFRFFAHHPEAGLCFASGYERLLAFDDRADTLTSLQFYTEDHVTALAVDRIRCKLYAAYGYGIAVFDARTGNRLRTLEPPDEVTRLALDSSTGRLFCGGFDAWRRITVYDCTTDSLAGTIGGPLSSAVALHPSRPELITAAGNKVYFSSTESLVVLDSIVLPFSIEDTGLVVDRRSNRLYVLYISEPRPAFDRWLAVIDLATDSLLRVVDFGVPLHVVDAVVAEPPSGSKLYLRDAVHDSLVVLSPDGAIIGGVQLGFNTWEISGCAWHPGLNRLYAASVDTAFGVDCAADTIAEVVSYAKLEARWMKWLPSVSRLYLGSQAGIGWVGPSDSIERWQPATDLSLASSDGSTGRLYLHGGDRLHIYDCATDSFTGSVACIGDLHSAYLVRDMAKLYLMMTDSTLRVYDTRGDTFLSPLSVPPGRLDYNPMTRRLYSGGQWFCEIDPVTDSVLQRQQRSNVRTFAVNTASNELWILRYDGEIIVVACDSFRTVCTINLPAGGYQAAMDARHNKLYCLGEGPSHPVIDCASYRIAGIINSGPEPVYDGYLDTEHERLYLSTWWEQVVIDTRTDSALGGIAAPGYILASDPADNVLYAYHRINDQLSVIRDNPPGVVEGRSPLNASRISPEATVVRGVLHFPVSSFGFSHSSLIDAAGRRLLDLSPGPNDVSRLAPGVYFVRSTIANRQSTMTKVVLAR